MPETIDKKLYSVVALVTAGIYGLQAWNLNISYDALHEAHDAKILAQQARPFPYTSKDAERDWRLHYDEHQKAEQNCENRISSGLELLESRMLLTINKIEIPPKHVRESLDRHSAEIGRLQLMLKYHLDSKDKIKPDLLHQ